MPSGTTPQLRRRRRARVRSRLVQWLLIRRGLSGRAVRGLSGRAARGLSGRAARGLSGRVVRTGRRSALGQELGTLPRPAGEASASGTQSPSLAPAPRCPQVTGGGGKLDFSGPRELFSSLIGPLTEEEFFRNYWEREPLVIKRGCLATPHPYSSLFSLTDLHSIVARQPVRFGRHVNVCRYSNGRRRSYGEAGRRLGPGLLHRLWAEERATIQLLQPQQFQVWRRSGEGGPLSFSTLLLPLHFPLLLLPPPLPLPLLPSSSPSSPPSSPSSPLPPPPLPSSSPPPLPPPPLILLFFLFSHLSYSFLFCSSFLLFFFFLNLPLILFPQYLSVFYFTLPPLPIPFAPLPLSSPPPPSSSSSHPSSLLPRTLSGTFSLSSNLSLVVWWAPMSTLPRPVPRAWLHIMTTWRYAHTCTNNPRQ